MHFASISGRFPPSAQPKTHPPRPGQSRRRPHPQAALRPLRHPQQRCPPARRGSTGRPRLRPPTPQSRRAPAGRCQAAAPPRPAAVPPAPGRWQGRPRGGAGGADPCSSGLLRPRTRPWGAARSEDMQPPPRKVSAARRRALAPPRCHRLLREAGAGGAAPRWRGLPLPRGSARAGLLGSLPPPGPWLCRGLRGEGEAGAARPCEPPRVPGDGWFAQREPPGVRAPGPALPPRVAALAPPQPAAPLL